MSYLVASHVLPSKITCWLLSEMKSRTIRFEPRLVLISSIAKSAASFMTTSSVMGQRAQVARTKIWCVLRAQVRSHLHNRPTPVVDSGIVFNAGLILSGTLAFAVENKCRFLVRAVSGSFFGYSNVHTLLIFKMTCRT